MKLVTSKKQGGFTLVELVMVIVVIALLSAYLGPKYASLESQARIAQLNKISGTFAESIHVVKAISIAELDANVPDLIGAGTSEELALTAVDYDGDNATTLATQAANITISGEDILTEFHYPKAVSDLTAALTEAGGGAFTSTPDDVNSIVWVLEATNATVLVGTDTDDNATVANLKQACGTALIDNNGRIAGYQNTLVAFEILGASAGAISTTDKVVIYPCGILTTSVYADTVRDTDLINTIDCSVTYEDAGEITADGTSDVFREPVITVASNDC